MSLEQLGKNAESGTLVLHLEDVAIKRIMNACDAYIDALRDLKQQAQDLATYPLGFAEKNLNSGNSLATSFQLKADGGNTSAAETFQSHKDRAEEIKTLFAALDKAYKSTDQSNANSFQRHGS